MTVIQTRAQAKALKERGMPYKKTARSLFGQVGEEDWTQDHTEAVFAVFYPGRALAHGSVFRDMKTSGMSEPNAREMDRLSAFFGVGHDVQ